MRFRVSEEEEEEVEHVDPNKFFDCFDTIDDSVLIVSKRTAKAYILADGLLQVTGPVRPC